MPKSYLVTAVEFGCDQRPTRSGVYMRRTPMFRRDVWSYFNAERKLWSCFQRSPASAHGVRAMPSEFQRLPWFALPHQIPAGARVERVSGLIFRVTEA